MSQGWADLSDSSDSSDLSDWSDWSDSSERRRPARGAPRRLHASSFLVNAGNGTMEATQEFYAEKIAPQAASG